MLLTLYFEHALQSWFLYVCLTLPHCEQDLEQVSMTLSTTITQTFIGSALICVFKVRASLLTFTKISVSIFFENSATLSLLWKLLLSTWSERAPTHTADRSICLVHLQSVCSPSSLLIDRFAWYIYSQYVRLVPCWSIDLPGTLTVSLFA